MPKKLTQKYVDSLRPGKPSPGKPTVIRDTEVRGLLVKVNAMSVLWVLQKELYVAGLHKKTLRVTLGRIDQLSVDDARKKARVLYAQIEAGKDPTAPTAANDSALTVQRAFDQYCAALLKKKGSGAERTVAYVRERLARYMGDWLELSLSSVTPEMCAARHDKIMSDIKGRAKNDRVNGARAANQTLRDFRAAYNQAAKLTRDLPENPAYGVTEARERAEHHQIQPEDLVNWHGKVVLLPSQLRQRMHLLGLFSGLRPGNLVQIERAWIKLDRLAICFPAEVMKGRRAFDLPLSSHMTTLVREAMQIGEAMFPGAPYLFPAKAAGPKPVKPGKPAPLNPSKSKPGEIVATQVWKEKKLPNATGHALRHSYSNIAGLARVDSATRMMLMAQKIPGIEGRYLDQPTQFARLLEDQEKITAELLKRLGAK